MEICFVVCDVRGTPCLLTAVGLLFCAFFMAWKHREVKAFCMPITNNSSLHIFLDICVYVSTVLTPVATYLHAYVWDNRDPNGIDAVFTGSTTWGHLPHQEPVGRWSRPLFHSFFFSLREDAVLQLRAHSVIGVTDP